MEGSELDCWNPLLVMQDLMKDENNGRLLVEANEGNTPQMLLSLLRIHERMTNEPRLFEVNKVLNNQLHYLEVSPKQILDNWNEFIGKAFLSILKNKAENNELTYQFVQNCLLTFMPLLKFTPEQIYEMTIFVLAECTKSTDRDRMALLREWVTYCCASTDYRLFF